MEYSIEILEKEKRLLFKALDGCNNGEKVPNHSKSPTQVALEVATNQLAEAMDIIDGYLNAGTKDQRKALSGRAKELYRDYYGVYFQNYRDRNKSSNTP